MGSNQLVYVLMEVDILLLMFIADYQQIIKYFERGYYGNRL